MPIIRITSNITGRTLSSDYTIADLICMSGEEELVENMTACNCKSVVDYTYTECNCDDEWSDYQINYEEDDVPFNDILVYYGTNFKEDILRDGFSVELQKDPYNYSGAAIFASTDKEVAKRFGKDIITFTINHPPVSYVAPQVMVNHWMKLMNGYIRNHPTMQIQDASKKISHDIRDYMLKLGIKALLYPITSEESSVIIYDESVIHIVD